MNNIVKVNFNQKDETNGVRQMFAFAADDYRGKTGKTAQIAIGGILEESDTEETIKEFVSGLNTILIMEVLFPGATLSVRRIGIILSSVDETEIMSKGS